MKKTYPRYKFTAETFLRIEQLHLAAARLFARRQWHLVDANSARAERCSSAAYRLQQRAFMLGMQALSPVQLDRLCQINTARRDARKAPQTAVAA